METLARGRSNPSRHDKDGVKEKKCFSSADRLRDLELFSLEKEGSGENLEHLKYLKGLQGS